MAIVNDASQYKGNMGVFKQLTGGERMREEEKGKEGVSSYVYKASVVIVTNKIKEPKDQTTGRIRRRVTRLREGVDQRS